jgi:hypothetical protein
MLNVCDTRVPAGRDFPKESRRQGGPASPIANSRLALLNDSAMGSIVNRRYRSLALRSPPSPRAAAGKLPDHIGNTTTLPHLI